MSTPLFETLHITSDVSVIVVSVALMLISGFAMTRITKRLRLPNVTAYIVAGILIGPYCFNLIPARIVGGMGFIADIALAFIAFSTGEFFKFSTLKKSGPKVLIITVMEACLASILVFIVVYFILGLELNFSIVLAALASATAPASTVMTIRQTHAKGDFVETLLQVVALDDVVGLLAYSIAISVALASMTGTFQAGHIVKPIVLNIAVFLLGGLFGVFLKLLLHKRSTDNRLIVSVALLFAFCGICAVFDVSPLLGCMSMSIPVESWNDALSPWEAPAVWGKQGFGGNAADTLRFLTEQVIPTLKQQFELSENVKIILGGYSLAGLFSLWASTQTDLFHSIAAASPSVWFPGWMEFEQRHPIQTQHIYLSLGDKEEHTKNTVMAAVGDNIRTLHSRLAERGTDCTLEWNSGGHFKDADLRTAKAFRWTMEEHACSNGKTDIVHCSLCIHECGAKDLWQ